MSVRTIPAASEAAGNSPASMLRLVLRIDSVSTAVMAVVLITAGTPLESATGMRVAFSAGFGILQLGGATALALIAGYPVIPPGLARAAIGVNTASGIACLAIAFGNVVELTGFGVTFMAIGAVIALAYAALEHQGLRRMTRATT